MHRIYSILVWIIPGIYLVSFLLPVVDGADYGWQAFLISFLSLFDPNRNSGHVKVSFLIPLAWFANPALWIGYFFLLRGSFSRSVLAAISAMLLALPILFLEGNWPLAGYWLWLSSMLTLTLAAGIQLAGKGR